MQRDPHCGLLPPAAWAADDAARARGRVAISGARRPTDVVALAQERYATHELFPGGRVRDYCTFTEVDLEAHCEIERAPGRSPQRVMRRRP